MSARSVKRLQASIEASRHQREWFESLEGPVAVADADVPHELFRAFGLPYVVNQWWASVCAAKQKAPQYLGLLRERGYPDDVEQYGAIALGSTFAGDAPWGGLPEVSLFATQAWTETHRSIAEAWTLERGVPSFVFSKTVDPRLPERWWKRIAHEWEDVIGTARLDLFVDELEGLCERLGGRPRGLEEILALANEQAEWNRRTRDLIANAERAPIDIADSIPAVMLPQWHRGSEWGRDAARRLYEEVAELVEAGEAVCPDERVRLMWIGRGVWFNLGFYQHFMDSYGAVFVWSMYLAIAADGYARYGGPPLRALAARFAAFSDFLGLPGWADEWYVKEAKLHRVDGVVHLVSSESRQSWFTTRALREAGIPVLELDANNTDAREWDEAAFTRALSSFVETLG